MVDINVVYDKLCNFESANDLASYFKELGIKGVEQDAMACPITNYVMMETNLNYVITNTEYLTVSSRSPSIYDNTDVVFQGRHTAAMADFVHEFDQGKYPELVDTEAQHFGC